jgi:CDP-diacylglycerol--glycerol-3-phosphate 3-phosphatidyltransferase
MLNRYARAGLTRVLTPFARLLLRLGVSPDAVTVVGTVLVVAVALLLIPTGHLVWAPLLLSGLALSDAVDGIMARASGRSSAWGAFLDSTLDRFGDAAIFAGLVLWSTGGRGDRLTTCLALACLALGSIVPYARARAEGIGARADVGIAERADRVAVAMIAIFAVGLGLPVAVLTVALGLLALASLVTVVQRVIVVRRQVLARPVTGTEQVPR